MKVCVEIARCADAGLVPAIEEIISIAGTGAGGGCDTAVIDPANAHNLFDTRIHRFCANRVYSLIKRGALL
jgi:hypothetical protein